MPVPFRFEDELERLGTAAFLRIVPESDGYQGAFFLVDARGEPVEFAYNRIEVMKRFLWREDQLQRHAARRLVTTLLEICPRVPSLLLCRADEVSADLFTDEVRLSIPAARLADRTTVVGQSAQEELEQLSGADVQIFWTGGQPSQESRERSLVDELAKRGLLMEPFDRAAIGLREVYGDAAMVE